MRRTPRAEPRGRLFASDHLPARARLVQGRDRLRDARQGVLRLDGGRDRRPGRAHLEARLPPGPGHHLPLAAPILPLPAPRRRLRHRGLPRRPPRVRHARRVPPARGRGAPARHRRPHRAGGQPHLRPAPVVPTRPQGAAGLPGARLVRLERHRRAVQGREDHLPRHRALQLDVGPGGARVLLAPVLQPPARPQLRQPGGGGRGRRGDAFLARGRRGRLPARRHPVPRRARRHEL